MKNSKLIQLLKTFSGEEINDFEKFLKSPLSNSRNYVIKFFQELKKHYPEFKENNIDKKEIFLKIYKDKEYNDSTVRSIVSSLITDAEHYLSYANFRSNKAIADYHLLSELSSRGLHNYLDVKAKPVMKRLKENKQFDFHDIIYDYLNSLKVVEHYFIKERFEDAIELVNLMNNNLLALFTANTSTVIQYNYIIRSFFPYATANYLENIFFPNLNYEGIISSLGNDNSYKAEFIKLNFYIYALLVKNNSHESYEKVKEIWLNSRDFLTVPSRKAVFDVLGNFCLLQSREKNTKYIREFFELSKVMLRDNLFLIRSNVMHINTFRQITLHSFALNEIEWCEEFVREYSKYLAEEEKEMLVDLAMAEISLRKKNFQNALTHLSNIKDLKSYLKLELREIYIRVYYELGHTEELYYCFDSFRHYLNNAPFLPDYILSAKNFLRYVSAILNHKIKNNSDINNLRREISEEPYVHFKKWLLEKADELFS